MGIKTEDFLAIAEDENFRDLLHRTRRECLSWNEFLRAGLPAGESAMDTWEMLGAIRRATAVHIPVPDVYGGNYWYSATQQISAALSTIACSCRGDSPLHRAVRDTAGQQFLVRMRIEEAVASAQLDGLIASPQRTYDLLSLDRAPRTANERLVANTVALSTDLGRFADEPFSRELLMRLHDMVLDGIDPEALEMSGRQAGFGIEDFPEEDLVGYTNRQLDYLCAYANHETGDPFDHPIVRALIFRESIRGYQLLPIASGAVARLAFSLYCQKQGLPILSMLPISKGALDWENGDLIIDSFPEREILHRYPRYKEFDLTPYVTITTQATLMLLRDLESYVERSARQDEEMQVALREHRRLNHRQRSVLAQALRSPHAEFQIRSHKTKYGIAYSTAHADLMKLAQLGYLEQVQRGKTYLFRPHAEIENRVGQHKEK